MIVFGAGVGRLIIGHSIDFRVGRWLLKDLNRCVLEAVHFALVVVVDAGGRRLVIVEDVWDIQER